MPFESLKKLPFKIIILFRIKYQINTNLLIHIGVNKAHTFFKKIYRKLNGNYDSLVKEI